MTLGLWPLFLHHNGCPGPVFGTWETTKFKERNYAVRGLAVDGKDEVHQVA